jgi:uncharacterized protein (DUF983 family)
MRELIDRAALIAEYDRVHVGSPGGARKLMEDAPTIEERKVGAWTNNNACPFCGFQPWYERDIHTLSYCSNCGADMRGERNDKN